MSKLIFFYRVAEKDRVNAMKYYDAKITDELIHQIKIPLLSNSKTLVFDYLYG